MTSPVELLQPQMRLPHGRRAVKDEVWKSPAICKSLCSSDYENQGATSESEPACISASTKEVMPKVHDQPGSFSDAV